MIKQITPNLHQLHFKEFGSCVYLLKLNNKKILIDTSSKMARKELLQDLKKLKIKPKEINIILLTHNHYDHIENINLFPNAKLLKEKEIKEQFPEIQTIKTPGHSKNDLCYLYKDILFSGDVIFDKKQTYVGRTDLPESNPKKMQESLQKLKTLKYAKLCPGHLV